MIGLLFGLIAYIMFASGLFGAEVIYSLGVMETWYYFVLWIVGIIAVIAGGLMLLGGTAVGANAGTFGGVLGFIAGGSIGTLVAARIVIVTLIQLAIINWLMAGIDPTIVDMDGLNTKQFIAFAFLVILPFLLRNNNSSSNSGKRKTTNVSSSDFNQLFRTKFKNHSKSRVTFS